MWEIRGEQKVDGERDISPVRDQEVKIRARGGDGRGEGEIIAGGR